MTILSTHPQVYKTLVKPFVTPRALAFEQFLFQSSVCKCELVHLTLKEKQKMRITKDDKQLCLAPELVGSVYSFNIISVIGYRFRTSYVQGWTTAVKIYRGSTAR
jgi:hypothetical protein